MKRIPEHVKDGLPKMPPGVQGPSPAVPGKPTRRRPYQSPRLIRYGTLEELTESNGLAVTEDLGSDQIQEP